MTDLTYNLTHRLERTYRADPRDQDLGRNAAGHRVAQTVHPHPSALIAELSVVEPLHDEIWTRRLLDGRANELDNLDRLLGR